MEYVANYADFFQTGCLSGAASMAWGETPSTGARGQLSNPHSLTWCGTPAEGSGRRAEGIQAGPAGHEGTKALIDLLGNGPHY